MKSLKYWFFILMVGTFASCEPYLPGSSDLGDIPTPSFDILQGSTPNEFIFVNTSNEGFIIQWDFNSADLGTREGDEVTLTFPFAGTYDVIMTIFGHGGHASLTKSLTIDQDDPNACFGNLQILTGCTEKVWKLANEPGALHVGPSLDETWWQNSSDDLIDRACHFDDEYIFRENGEYEYDNKGEFFADSDPSGMVIPADLGLPVGCNSNADWPPQYAGWGSNTHSFIVTNNTLEVVGLGAWIGLYKVGTFSEVTTPQSSVKLNILEISDTRMGLFADYGGLGWKMTFVSN
jgi:PKD repeat protein